MSNTTNPTTPYFSALSTSVGGAASENFSVPGLKAGDIVFAQIATEGGVPVSIVRAIAASNVITVEFSADPSNDHVVNLVAFKAGVLR
jgi:hypothetical protein